GRLPAFVLCATLVAACSDHTNEDSQGHGDTTPATAPATSRAGSSLEEVTDAGAAKEPAHLIAIHTEASGTLGRIVFEFDGGATPGYTIGYADEPVTQDGSGATVDVAGEAVLRVRFSPASTVDLTNGVRQTYTGPARFSP